MNRRPWFARCLQTNCSLVVGEHGTEQKYLKCLYLFFSHRRRRQDRKEGGGGWHRHPGRHARQPGQLRG